MKVDSKQFQSEIVEKTEEDETIALSKVKIEEKNSNLSFLFLEC